MSNRNNILIGVIFFLTILCITYSNHFTNGFEFDDTHTIVNNQYIRNINNVPLFFTDIKYYGTNPGNQGYNPILVTLNTVDYWWAGELNPVYFHVSIFFVVHRTTCSNVLFISQHLSFNRKEKSK